jgi:hypothetical protein
MKRLNGDQAIWLARGAAIGSLLLWVMRAVRGAVGHLRGIGFARGRLPKRP